MPLIEAGWVNKEGVADGQSLIKFGPTTQVIIGHVPNETDVTPKEPITVHALIDTGAQESCIDIKIATELNLPIVDVQMISGAGGVKKHPVYMGHIYIPSLEKTLYGRFAGVDLIAGGQSHGALLGRTFLQGTVMIYDGLRSQVTLASPIV